MGIVEPMPFHMAIVKSGHLPGEEGLSMVRAPTAIGCRKPTDGMALKDAVGGWAVRVRVASWADGG